MSQYVEKCVRIEYSQLDSILEQRRGSKYSPSVHRRKKVVENQKTLDHGTNKPHTSRKIGYPAKDPTPASDPTQEDGVFRWRKHKDPMILASGCWSHRSHFCKGGSCCQCAYPAKDESMDQCDWATVVHCRIVGDESRFPRSQRRSCKRQEGYKIESALAYVRKEESSTMHLKHNPNEVAAVYFAWPCLPHQPWCSQPCRSHQ